MRKRVVMLCMLASLAAGLFAQGTKESTKADEPITLEFWTHEDKNRQALEERFIAEFQAQHPHVTIIRSTYPSNRIGELIQTAYASNSGPDIFNLQITQEYVYAANGLAAPVDYQAVGYKDKADLEAHYMEGILDPITVDGKVYGMPLEITNWVTYMNKNVFRDAGLDPEKDYPRTWEDMVAVAGKLTLRDGDIITRRAFDFNYDLPIPQFQPMLEQLGARFVSEDGLEAIVGKDGWIKFFQFMQDWGPNGKNYGNPTLKIARKLFNANNNDIGMAMMGLYQEPRIKNDNPEFYASDDWALIPFPKFANSVPGSPRSSFIAHYYMVNSHSSPAKQKAAWQFIGYCLSHYIEYLTDGGTIVQPVRGILDSPEMKALRDSQVVLDGLAESDCILYGEQSIEIENLFKTALTSVMIQGVSPEDAYAQLKKEAQAALGN